MRTTRARRAIRAKIRGMTEPKTPLDATDARREPQTREDEHDVRRDPPTPTPSALPAAPAPRRLHRLREKLPELLLEAGSVVLAVLLALGVDEWRENRARRALAGRVQESIVREIRANSERLARVRKSNASRIENINAQIKALEGKTPVSELIVYIDLAQLSGAAWQAAQSTEALQLLTFTWLVDVASTYEAQRLVADTQRDVVSRIGNVAPANTQAQRLTEMRHVASRMSVLMMLSQQLADAYDEALKTAPPAP